jgi:hypothetical protein
MRRRPRATTARRARPRACAFTLRRIEQRVEHERPAEALGVGDVTRRVDEGGEVAVADRGGVDPVRRQRDLAHRAFAVVGKRIVVSLPMRNEPPAMRTMPRCASGRMATVMRETCASPWRAGAQHAGRSPDRVLVRLATLA